MMNLIVAAFLQLTRIEDAWQLKTIAVTVPKAKLLPHFLPFINYIFVKKALKEYIELGAFL
jgi:hypothetical protein